MNYLKFKFLMEGNEEAFAKREYHADLKQQYPKGVPAYHESPGHDHADSIRKHGLNGEDHGGTPGAYFRIGTHSGFISGKKLRVHFTIPHTHSQHIHPDDRYDPQKPHHDAMEQHNWSTHGSDAGYHHPIPPHWINKIEKV